MKRLCLTVFILVLGASVAQAQFSLSAPLYSEQKLEFKAPVAMSITMQAFDDNTGFAYFNGNRGKQPVVPRGVGLKIRLIPQNIEGLEKIELQLALPSQALLESERGWLQCDQGPKELAYDFEVNTNDLDWGANFLVLRLTIKSRTRHRALFVINWVSTSRGTQDQILALEVQDRPAAFAQAHAEQLFPLLQGFEPRTAMPQGMMTQTAVPSQIANQTVKQSNSAGNDELPDDLPMPKAKVESKEEILPEDLPMPTAKHTADLNGVAISLVTTDRSDFRTGWISQKEFDLALKSKIDSTTVELGEAKDATVYLVSTRPFTARFIFSNGKSVTLDVTKTNSRYWSRVWGTSQQFSSGRIEIRQGQSRQTTKFEGGSQ